MYAISLIVLVTVVAQGCHQGSRMIAALLAINLGANPLMVGVLISVYSVFPLFLAVYAGRICDRFGSRYPMMAGIALIGLGLLVPSLWPRLAVLYVSAVLIGTGFVFFNVAVQNFVGGFGPLEERTRNFSTLALGRAGGHLLGPVVAGHAIDYHGFTFAYLVFAALTLLPVVLLGWYRRLETVPRHAMPERK